MQQITRGTALDAGGRVKKASASASSMRVLNECVEQLLVADHVVINKCDLVTSDHVAAVRAKVAALNPMARITQCEFGRVNVSDLLGVASFQLDGVLSRNATLFEASSLRTHDRSVVSMSLRGSGAYDSAAEVQEWLEALHLSLGPRIFRSKGVFRTTRGARHIFHGVHELVDVQPLRVDDDDPDNRFVFIGLDLDPRDVRVHYKMSFPAGPKIKLESLSGFQKDADVFVPQEGASTTVSVVAMLLALLIFYMNSTGVVDLKTWEGLGIVAALLVLFMSYAALASKPPSTPSS